MRVLTIEINLSHNTPSDSASLIRKFADIMETGLLPDERFHLVRESRALLPQSDKTQGIVAQAWIDPKATKLSRVQS